MLPPVFFSSPYNTTKVDYSPFTDAKTEPQRGYLSQGSPVVKWQNKDPSFFIPKA